ncbi:MAG TPA: tetratricopeptide repeat protein, partial [Candidatus Melainabacteria bacterium]|nr:tetratricopeptide repeat protein [Candidatus Melainabacteria bacterium]
MPARYHQSKIATSLFTAMLLSVGSGSAEAQTENADSLVKQAISEAKQQKHIDAIRNYSKAINLSPEHHPAYFYRARSRKALADYQNAVLDYNFAIKLNPKSSLAYTERGWCLTKLDLPKRAMNDLDQALKLNPKNTRALEYRASLKYKQGD